MHFKKEPFSQQTFRHPRRKNTVVTNNIKGSVNAGLQGWLTETLNGTKPSLMFKVKMSAVKRPVGFQGLRITSKVLWMGKSKILKSTGHEQEGCIYEWI